MRRLFFLAAWLALTAPAAADWPWWRGPNRNGVVDAKEAPPLEWGEAKNVVWKAPVPGRGHGSPIIVGDRVFLATADEAKGSQSVLCVDRKTGKELWHAVVHASGAKKEGNSKASLASCTPACDGKRVFVNFLNRGAIWTTALDLDGKQLWQEKITDYVLHQGFGSSPAVYGPLVIVSADTKGGTGAIKGLDRETGKEVWKQDRAKAPNYTSPIILRAAGREQLFFTGVDRVSSFEPLTGKKGWEIKGSTTECVTSTVTDGERIFTSGGYPRNHVSAVRADGSGKVEWENDTRVYVPSMIAHKGHLYAVTDAGFAVCWKSDSGKEVWRKRLGGTFSSSLVLAGERLLATNESGLTYVFKATPEEPEVEARNQLGNEVLTTPAVCGGRLYHRVAVREKGKRQEWLYCIGSERP